MATRFEIVLHGENEVALRAAGEEALNEIERLEARLSLYRATSEINQINARAFHAPVRVEPQLFRLLQRAQRISLETEGTFDPTIAPLMRCWGFMGAGGRMPEPQAILEARERVGMHHVLFDEDRFTVRFLREGLVLDLGAIGKGYAVEQAAELLIENGITSGLIHGGTSTVFAIGSPPGAEGWEIAIERPEALRSETPDHSSAPHVSRVRLKNESLSVSAPHGKSFTHEGRVYGHVLDPRSGYPVQGALLAAVSHPSATDTDALSTSLLVWGKGGADKLAALYPGIRALAVGRDPTSGAIWTESRGFH